MSGCGAWRVVTAHAKGDAYGVTNKTRSDRQCQRKRRYVDEDVDGHHVLGLDAEEDPEEKFLVAEDHGNGDEEAEDAGPAAGGGDVGTQTEDVGEGDGGGEDGAADDGGEVEFGEPAGAEGGLEE